MCALALERSDADGCDRIDELRNLNMPAGVDIRVKAMLDEK